MVKYQRMFVALKTTSHVKQHFKSCTASLYHSLVTSLHPLLYQQSYEREVCSFRSVGRTIERAGFYYSTCTKRAKMLRPHPLNEDQAHFYGVDSHGYGK